MAVVTLLVGCGSNDAPTSGVEVLDPWARPTSAATTVGAAYLTLRSAGKDALVAASVGPEIAAEATIHQTLDDDGEMSMDHVARIELPAGDDVTFEPGGLHVMLVDLAAPLELGETFELTLDFERADTRTVTVLVLEQPP